MKEDSFDVAAWEVGAIAHRQVSGTIILLDETGRPVNVDFTYRRGAEALDVVGDSFAAQWLRQHGAKDALEMIREAFDTHRATLNRMN